MLKKQDYINAVEQDIIMVRGDTLHFNFELAGLGDTVPDIAFICKKHPSDTQAMFTCDKNAGGIQRVQKVGEVSTYSVKVDPQKTATMDIARYYYNLVLTTDENTLTLMRGRIELVHNV